MAISRGVYGQYGRCTNEYFLVSAKAEYGTYMDIVAAYTKGMAYSQMKKKYPDCEITLRPTTKERYMEEMAEEAYWNKHRGGGRGPEPIL